METIGERLRYARMRAQYSSGSDAARAFGWPVSTYLGHENGDRQPSLDTIRKYAKAFRADAAFIAYGEGEVSISPDVKSMTRVKGIVSSGGEIFQDDFDLAAGDLVYLEMNLPENVFALLVATDSLDRRFEMGDIIIVRGGFTSDAGMLDRHVYVRLSDGKQYIRRVKRSSILKSFDLLPHSEDDALLKSKEIDEFGIIALIIPGGFYGDLNVRSMIASIADMPEDE